MRAPLGTAVLLTALCAPASAQMVVKADVANAQPQIGRDDKGFSFCGLRVVALDTIGKHVDAYDFSLNLSAKFFDGLIKAGKTRVLRDDMMNGRATGKPATPGPIGFWIAAENEGKALHIDDLRAAETPGFILANAEIVDTLQTIVNVAQGQRMQFTMKYKGEKTERVVSFSVKMTQEEQAPLLACLDGITQRIIDAAK